MKILSIYKSYFKTIISILSFVLIACFFELSAQVTTLNAWTNFYNGAANTTANYSVPAGSNSNRLLVVAIATSTRTASTRSIGLSYGNQSLTAINGDLSTSSIQHTQFYYLNEAGLDAATAAGSQSLVFTVNGGTTVVNSIFVSVYDNVYQASPITDSEVYNSGAGTTASVAFVTALTVNPNDLALKIVSSVRTGNATATTITNIGTNWTSNDQRTGTYNPGGSGNDLGVRNAISTRSVPLLLTTDAATVTLNVATLASMTGITLKSVPKYFRSNVTSGSWNTLASWQQSLNGTSGWVTATSVPTSSDIRVTIQAGNTITLGSVTECPDLIIDGNLVINGTNTLTPTSATINGSVTVSATGSLINGTGVITFNSGSTYTHNRDGGAIPISSWNVNSTCLVSGVITALPTTTTFLQSFGNITFNNTSQTGNLSLQGQLTTINGNFSMQSTGSGSIRLTDGGGTMNANFNGNYTQSGGTLFIYGEGTGGFAATLTVYGNFAISNGTLNIVGTSATGNLNLKGNYTMSGGTITETNSGIANILFNGTSTQVYSKTAGAYANTINFGVDTNSTVDFGTSIIDAASSGTFSIIGGGTVLTKNTGGFALTGATGTVQVTSARVYSATANYVFNGTSAQVTGTGVVTANNITINNTDLTTGVTLSASTTVNNLLTLTAGKLNLSSYNMTLGAAATIAGTFSNASMIVTSGTGQLRKLVTSTPFSFTFPIGDATTGDDYSPMKINIATATLAPGALVAVNVVNSKHPQDGSSINYLNRYWTINQTGVSNMSASVKGTFVPTDIPIGSQVENIITSRFVTPSWIEHNVASADSISANSLIAFGDFTGRNNLAIITVVPTAISDFTYLEGLGPSTIKSFNVSGSALSTNITILPTLSFEISTLGGASFSPSSLLTIDVVNREVPSTTVYVRMKAGLPVGAVAIQKIYPTSLSTSDSVACSGIVTNAPLIEPTVTNLVGSPALTSLSNFVYTLGSTTSTAQSFYVKGTYLSDNIKLKAPTNYEISLDNTTYADSLLLTQSGGNIASTQIFVRLKLGLLTGNYSGNITFTSTNAITKQVALTGTVGSAKVAVSKLTLAGFIYTSGESYSEVQSVNVSGTTLVQNLTVTPPTDFEISTNATTGFASTPINIAPDVSGTVASTPIYVRMKGGLPTGPVAAQNIVVTSGTAISQNVACSGLVVTGATTISSNGVFNGFMYVVNRGPSIKQNFTVSATSLTDSVTVTPPTNFEISKSGLDGTFVSSTSTRPFFRIAQTGGKVNAIPVYVRLKAGFPVGTYNNQNIVLSSPGAIDVNVVCNGTIVSQPTIVAGPTGLENLCPTNNVTLTSTGTNITTQTWTGPNGFTSTAQNPVLGTVTALQNGTYTVSSSIKSNVNLLTNGDFSAGNKNFGSSYKFWTYGTQSYLQNQYTIGPNPASLNSGFCNQPTGRAGTGGNQMIIDGATLAAGGAGAIAWSQSIEIEEGATYQFSYWVQNIWPASPAILQFYIDGVATGNVHNVTATTCSWVQVIVPYKNTGSTRIVQLSLVDLNLIAQGNDFSLDDFEFQLIFEVSSSVNLTVNPTLAPSVVVTASDNPVFSNTIVTYTAIPTNGGTSPTYQWKVNGVKQGGLTTSTTFDYTPVQGDSISCVLHSTYPCAAPDSALNYVKMTVNPRTNYWRGNISTDWGTAENWTGGFVPLAGDDVEFAKKSNNNQVAAERNLQLDINRTIGYLVNDSANLSVIIPPNLTLIVNNNIQSTSNPDKVIVHASTSQPNGSIVYRNPQNQPVYGTVEMYSPASWDKTRPVNQKYNWQYFGIPLASLPAMPTFYGAYVRQLLEHKDKIENHWESLTNESVLIPFKGYELCQQNPNTLYVFKGQLVNQNYSSGQFVKTTTGNPLFPGQHLFANPYTSAIDIRQIDFGAGVEATAYLYNTGSFTSWLNNPIKSGTLTAPVPGQYFACPKNQAGTIEGIPRQIPSMGTFLVRVPKDSVTKSTSYININYNNVAMGNTSRQTVKSTTFADEQTLTSIEVEGEFGVDRMWIASQEMYSRGFDNGYDGFKMIGSAINPQIYAVEKDGDYQINSVDDINNTTLAFQAGQDTEYSMTFSHNENAQLKYKKMYLHDLVENRIIDISQSGTSYHFTAVSTAKPVIRFKVLSQNVNEESSKQSYTKVYSFDNQLYVQNFSELGGRVYVYDIAGRTVGIKSISGNQNIQIAAHKNNTYIVKIVVGNITETTKIFIK